jgi:hypothetical protein
MKEKCPECKRWVIPYVAFLADGKIIVFKCSCGHEWWKWYEKPPKEKS